MNKDSETVLGFDCRLAANALEKRLRFIQNPKTDDQKKKFERNQLHSDLMAVVSQHVEVPDEIKRKLTLAGGRLGSLSDIQDFIEKLRMGDFPKKVTSR